MTELSENSIRQANTAWRKSVNTSDKEFKRIDINMESLSFTRSCGPAIYAFEYLNRLVSSCAKKHRCFGMTSIDIL